MFPRFLGKSIGLCKLCNYEQILMTLSEVIFNTKKLRDFIVLIEYNDRSIRLPSHRGRPPNIENLLDNIYFHFLQKQNTLNIL